MSLAQSKIAELSQLQQKPCEQLNNLLDINTLIEQHPQFTEQQLRWIISQRKFNGINATETVLFKVGKRWFFDIPLFISWMKNKNS